MTTDTTTHEWSDPTKIRMLRAAVRALIVLLGERGVDVHPLITEAHKVLKQTETTKP